jgi:hypothetical protein
VKHPLEERAQELPKHFLGNPVADGGDPQRACLAWPLGDMHAPQGVGLESPFLEVVHQGQQVLFEVGLEHSDADFVDPRHAPVASNVPEGAVQEFQGDPSRQRMSLDLGHNGSFHAEPHATETLGSTRLPARGGRFLASVTLPERGSSGPERARRPRLTCLMVPRPRLPSHRDAPFARGLLWSSCHPQGVGRWGRPSLRRVSRPFRDAYGSGLLWPSQRRRGTLTGQCDQPLCPGETTNHLDGPQRPTVTRAAEKVRLDPLMLRQVRELGIPSRPNRDPSRTIQAWPLRQGPLPDPAGCVPFREESSSKDFRTGTAPHG